MVHSWPTYLTGAEASCIVCILKGYATAGAPSTMRYPTFLGMGSAFVAVASQSTVVRHQLCWASGLTEHWPVMMLSSTALLAVSAA